MGPCNPRPVNRVVFLTCGTRDPLPATLAQTPAATGTYFNVPWGCIFVVWHYERRKVGQNSTWPRVLLEFYRTEFTPRITRML